MNLTKCTFGFALLACWLSCSQVPDEQEGINEIGNGAGEEKMVVAAAANLRFVLEELESDFENKKMVDIEVIFASSGKLCSQILNGAPYDVFLSANMKFPRILWDEKLTVDEPMVYALGTLIFWSTKLTGLDGGMDRLMASDIDKIAIATDKNAPYGTAALEAMKSAGIYEKVKSKLVYGESVSQVNQYVLSESVAVGITNKSVVFSKMHGKGIWADVDPTLYSPIQQGIVVTKYGEKHHSKDARDFLDYLLSESAQSILAKYGYLAP